MFRFEHPVIFLVLLLAPLLLVLYFLTLRWKKRVALKIGDPVLVKRLILNYSPRRFLIKFIAALVAIALLVVAAANPQTRGEGGAANRKGLDLMILLDVSKSMLAGDIKPSRLERSRQLVSLLIDQLSDNRIGLVWFAGRAYLQMPLSTDASAAKIYLQNAGPDVVPTQGTVIGEALKIAGTAFNNKDKKYKAVILISDGEDHDPEALKVVKQLAESGVMINTVGVGTPEGATILDPATNEPKKDAGGNPVISRLNEQQLRALAQTGNGAYVYLQDPAAAVKTLKTQLASVAKKDLEDSASVQYNTWYFIGLALCLLVLLFEIVLPERKPLAP